MEYVSRQQIRFDDVDGAGIVYYPRFFHLCHKAFEDWFNDCGPTSYVQLISGLRRGFPTVAISSQFVSPLVYGDHALVTILVQKIGRSSLICHYRISNAHDIACFEAHITTVYMDLDSKKSVAITDDMRVFLEKYSART